MELNKFQILKHFYRNHNLKKSGGKKQQKNKQTYFIATTMNQYKIRTTSSYRRKYSCIKLDKTFFQ